MIVTQSDARKIISGMYPDMPFRLSTKAQIGVRPVYDPRPSLVWVKLDSGKDSAVKIGRLMANLTTDWSFDLSTH